MSPYILRIWRVLISLIFHGNCEKREILGRFGKFWPQFKDLKMRFLGRDLPWFWGKKVAKFWVCLWAIHCLFFRKFFTNWWMIFVYSLYSIFKAATDRWWWNFHLPQGVYGALLEKNGDLFLVFQCPHFLFIFTEDRCFFKGQKWSDFWA